MKVVLGTCSSDGDFNAGGDYAVVDLTPTYAALILNRMKALHALARSDLSLHEAHFWDADAAYFETTLDDEIDEQVEPAHDTYVVLDEGLELPSQAFKPVEYTHMVISVMGDELEVCWRATPRRETKHERTHRRRNLDRRPAQTRTCTRVLPGDFRAACPT